MLPSYPLYVTYAVGFFSKEILLEYYRVELCSFYLLICKKQKESHLRILSRQVSHPAILLY